MIPMISNTSHAFYLMTFYADRVQSLRTKILRFDMQIRLTVDNGLQ